MDQSGQAGGAWTRLPCHNFLANEVRLQRVHGFSCQDAWRSATEKARCTRRALV